MRPFSHAAKSLPHPEERPHGASRRTQSALAVRPARMLAMTNPSPEQMRYIDMAAPGGPEVLTLTTGPVPRPATGEVLIRVAAAGVNRPDILQRTGNYPPPPGASPIPGLEVSGTIAALGPDLTEWREGEPVCALV